MLYSAILWSTFLFVHYAKGVSIYIENAGFESTTGFDQIPLPQNTYYYNKGVIIDKWNLYDPQNIADEWAEGVHNPQGSALFDDPVFGDSSPEGRVSGYIENDDNKNAGKGALGIQQTLTTTITRNTKYTLTVFVGNDRSNCYDKGSTDGKENCYDGDGFPGYRVQLFAGNTLLAEDDNSISIPEGQWALSTVIYTTDSTINESLNLKIRLIDKNIIVGDICFDDVQLNAETTTTTTTTTTSSPTTTTTDVPATTTTTTTTTTAATVTVTTNPPDPTSTETATVIVETSVDEEDDEKKEQESGEAVVTDIEPGIVQLLNIRLELLVMFGVTLFLLCCFCVCVVFICYKIYGADNTDKVVEEVQGHEKVDVVVDDKYVKIQNWFKFDVGFAHYGPIFIANGYDSMEAIMAIDGKDQLIDIGVTSLADQKHILIEVRKLRSKNGTPGNDTTDKVYKLKAIHQADENYGLKTGPMIPGSVIQRNILYDL